MTVPAARRGEVWFAEVPGDKRRPVLVLTRDPMGRILHSVICAPITSTIRDLATEVPIGEDVGLAAESVANFDNTLLLARTRLRLRRLGRASDDTGHAVCRALTIAAGVRRMSRHESTLRRPVRAPLRSGSPECPRRLVGRARAHAGAGPVRRLRSGENRQVPEAVPPGPASPSSHTRGRLRGIS